MRKLLIPLLFVCSRLTISAQTQILVLHHADKTTTEVELYTQPKITFEGDRMVIASSVLHLSFQVGDVVRFSYRDTNTAVRQPDADYTQQNGQIVFNGIQDASKITVYKSDGTRMPVRFSNYNGQLGFSLSSLPTGVYILSINGKTAKIVRPRRRLFYHLYSF